MSAVQVASRLPLNLPGRFEKTGLVLPNDLAFDDWERVGEFLRAVEGRIQWWVGDWLLYGERAYGDKYTEALEKTDYEYGSLRNAKSIAARFELSRRRDNLSWSHHAEVSSLANDEQDHWLELAESRQWSREDLRRELKNAKRLEGNRAELRAVDARAQVQQREARDFLGELYDESVDLLLTDPPYSTDVDDVGAFAESWLPLALSKVKPTGRAYIFIGAYPVELQAYLGVLEGDNRLQQVLVWHYENTLGPAPAHSYKLNWQACLYLRGPEAPPLNCPLMVEQFSVVGISAPDGRHEGRLHPWEKPEELAERFIRHATRPGEIVLDPFAGTGTFLVASARLGRQAIGSELDSDQIAICRARGVEVTA